MQKAGYGPDKHLQIKVSTRNIAVYRDPAIILIDQLKSIYIDAELDVVDTAQWFPKVARKDYSLGLNLTGNAASTSPTSRSTRTMPAAPSGTTPTTATRTSRSCSTSSRKRPTSTKRKKLVWEIDKKLQEDVARPIIFHARTGTCWEALREEHHGDVQQLLQRLSLRRRLAGQVRGRRAFSSEYGPRQENASRE